jgi:hypothetical protein
MNRNRHAALWILLAGIFLAVMLLFCQSLAAQCQMCRTALTQSAEGQRWARGINAGILLLLAAPFLICGAIAFVVWRPQVARCLIQIERAIRGGSKGNLSLD